MNQPLLSNTINGGLPSSCGKHSGLPVAQTIARYALQSLHQELAAYPKPGLVSPFDSGSHQDMDAPLFFRSLFSLRNYFRDITVAGLLGATFSDLKQYGIAAEARMLKATRGINTHRGAIFNLGLLAAAAGQLLMAEASLQKYALSKEIRRRWGDALRQHGKVLPKTSHGGLVTSRYGVGGAVQEAASGFPHVFLVGLPALQNSLSLGADSNSAAVQCIFSLMEVLPDTNLLYRGGRSGLSFAQKSASSFLQEGGVHNSGWRDKALETHQEFIRRNLSPGGCADLLAATLFVHRLQSADATTVDKEHRRNNVSLSNPLCEG